LTQIEVDQFAETNIRALANVLQSRELEVVARIPIQVKLALTHDSGDKMLKNSIFICAERQFSGKY
jgi:hypothetical protein